MFIIIEEYEEDGGFGDSVYTERPIGIVETEEEAKEYVKLYSCEHVYNVPYDSLMRGGLSYYELPLINIHNNLDENITKLERYKEDAEDNIRVYSDTNRKESFKESLHIIESKLKELNAIKEKENQK